MANPFLDHWIVLFGIQSYLIVNIGPQFVGMFFAFFSDGLGVKHLTKRAYH